MTSSYAKRMSFLAGRIFVDIGRKEVKGSQRIVRVMSEQTPGVILRDWYPPVEETRKLFSYLRFHGHFRDEYRDFKEEMTRLRELRGKVKPKKGEGKRS